MIEDFLKKNKIKKENIMYLPIAEPFFSRILNGAKKVEFRALTDFYLRKLMKIGKNGEDLGDKPIKYVDFRNGYKNASECPRILVELKDWFVRDQSIPKEQRTRKIEPSVQKEIQKEGFDDETDEFIAFVLGGVVAKDNVR